MKTLIQFKTILLLLVSITFFSCDNDDDANLQTCTTQGFFYTLGSNPQNFEPEVDLFTDFFQTSANGPEVEIFNSSTGTVFVTTVVGVNQTGTADLMIGNGPNETVNVVCLANGSSVGDSFRFAISGTYNGSPISAEFCVAIDSVH